MSVFKCSKCEELIDSDFSGLVKYQYEDYCLVCFDEKLQCETCEGYINSESIMASGGEACHC